MITKAQLRREIAARRRTLDSGWMAEASLRIVQRLLEAEAFKAAKTMALYKAIAGEVELESLFARCWALGMKTCIPVFNAEENGYQLAEVDRQTGFIAGNYGIQEPLEVRLIPVRQVDLMVVPGVAFDPAGNRLGRGGGYYDRLLKNFAGTAVAVAFDFQIIPHVPTDGHDLPVDSIITETKKLKVGNEH